MVVMTVEIELSVVMMSTRRDRWVAVLMLGLLNRGGSRRRLVAE